MNNNKISGKCSTYGERRGAYRGLVGKPEVKRPLARHRCGWVNTCIRVYTYKWIVKVKWGIEQVYLAQDRDR